VKYYVVSESELDDLYTADSHEKDEADAKCRTLQVRLVGLHGEGSSLMLWGEE